MRAVDEASPLVFSTTCLDDQLKDGVTRYPIVRSAK